MMIVMMVMMINNSNNNSNNNNIYANPLIPYSCEKYCSLSTTNVQIQVPTMQFGYAFVCSIHYFPPVKQNG